MCVIGTTGRALIHVGVVFFNYLCAALQYAHGFPGIRVVTLVVVVLGLVHDRFTFVAGCPCLERVPGYTQQRVVIEAVHAAKFVYRQLHHEVVKRDGEASSRNGTPLTGER